MAQWEESNPLLDGHFPGFPIVPGVLLVEAAAQAAGILIASSGREALPMEEADRPSVDGLGVLVGVKRAAFHKPVFAGNRLDLIVWLGQRIGDMVAVSALAVGKDGGRSVVISAQSGVLVVKAMPDELRNVDQFLKATQLAVDRQVILEAKILEVELNDSFQSGINWASFGSFSGTGRRSVGMINPGSGLASNNTSLPLTSGPLAAVPGSTLALATESANALFGLAFQTQHFAALLSFLESQGTVHVLSSPRVAAVNNQKALLKVGTDEFFVTGITTTTTTNSGGNTVIPSVTVQPFFSGVVLDVTPQIDENDNIVLHVHPSVSQVSTVNKTVNLGTLGNMSLPLAASDTSEIDTIVRGQNGQVVAIGGLMRQAASNNSNGVPGASNVPVFGHLFGNKARTSQKRELVVLIKPTIVEGSSSWNNNLLDTSRRIEALDPRQREVK